MKNSTLITTVILFFSQISMAGQLLNCQAVRSPDDALYNLKAEETQGFFGGKKRTVYLAPVDSSGSVIANQTSVFRVDSWKTAGGITTVSGTQMVMGATGGINGMTDFRSIDFTFQGSLGNLVITTSYDDSRASFAVRNCGQ
jgi:hypothetical protein